MTSENEKREDHQEAQDRIIIVIDDKKYVAPRANMIGTELRHLAVPPIGPDRDLFAEIFGPADDKKVADDEPIRLKTGMRFYSAPKTINPGDVPHLPESDEAYLTAKQFKWSLPAGGLLVLNDVPVSVEKYDRAAVDLLIQVPATYPMAALDMFYVFPALKLKNGATPPAAEAIADFLGRSWQRFSRHMTVWRPGVDSIKTFLALALAELQGKQ